MNEPPNQPINTNEIRKEWPIVGVGFNADARLIHALCDELDSRRDMIAHTQEQRNAEAAELREVQAKLAELKR